MSAKKIKESKSTIIIVRIGDSITGMYYATIRFLNYEKKFPAREYFFCYDTITYPTIKEALDEARAFCKWKGFKVRKIERRVYIR